MFARAPLALLVLAPLAAAGTIRVPKDQPTIQAAIDAAVEGDTILVAKGDYAETPVIDGRSGLLLRGSGHPRLAVGDAPSHDNGITVSDSTGISVIGFDVDGAANAGILVSNSTEVLVQRCRVEGAFSGTWSTGAYQVAGGSHVTLDRNRVDGHVIIGIRFFGEGGPEAADCTVTKNVVHTVWHAAIEVRGSGHHVERNTLSDADVGIFLDASDTTLLRNKVHDVDTGLDVFGGSGGHLERNSVHGAGSFGIHVEAGASDTTLLHDTVTASGSVAALLVEGSGLSSSEDRITKAKADGVQVMGSNCSFTDLRVSKPAGLGVSLVGGGHVLTDVRVTSPGVDGLEVTGDGNALNGCRAVHAAVQGFNVSGNDNSLQGCTSLDAASYDLATSGLNNTFTDCKFKTTWPEGL
jgi:nitrous oxidase accessory protein NosD